MISQTAKILSLLDEIESDLVELGFWDELPPAEEAFSSTAPFAVDTMEFYQWVQWIFIPTLLNMLEQQIPLPEKCGIAPMAEQWASTRAVDASKLITKLNTLDVVLSGESAKSEH